MIFEDEFKLNFEILSADAGNQQVSPHTFSQLMSNHDNIGNLLSPHRHHFVVGDVGYKYKYM